MVRGLLMMFTLNSLTQFLWACLIESQCGSRLVPRLTIVSALLQVNGRKLRFVSGTVGMAYEWLSAWTCVVEVVPAVSDGKTVVA